MAETTIVASVGGRVDHRKTNGWPSWSEVRDGAGTHTQDALVHHSDIMQLYPGGLVNGNQVWLRMVRSIFMFDTSTISPGLVITSASLWVYGNGRGDFDPPWLPDVCVVHAYPASDDEIVIGDYDSLGTTALSNIISWNDFLGESGNPQWNEFVLTQDGIDTIVKGGVTPFGFRNYNYDAVDNEPTIGAGSGWASLTITNGGATLLKLVITYTTHLVTTQAATEITKTSAWLHGTLVEDGGAPCECGFEWGPAADNLCYLTSTCMSSKGHLFTTIAPKTGSGDTMSEETTYYFRAFATHPTLGTVYGEILNFTTLGGIVYPAEPTIRVTGLIHRWFPGTYTLEMSLGAITTEFGLPTWTKEPLPPIPPDEPSPPPPPPPEEPPECTEGAYKEVGREIYKCINGKWVFQGLG